MKGMAPLHALGIDGFLAPFYQKFWHILGGEVTSFCLSILRGEISLNMINQTYVILLPKVGKPTTLHNFDL